MSFNLTINCATEDELLSVVQRLAGLDAAASAPAKKATPKQKAAAATTEEATPPAKPAATKKKGGKKKKAVISVDDLKKVILEAVGGDMTNPDTANEVKEYIATFNVVKISDMTEAQRTQAAAGAVDYFVDASEEEAEEEDDDPMA